MISTYLFKMIFIFFRLWKFENISIYLNKKAENTLSEQIQNQISESQKETTSIPLTYIFIDRSMSSLGIGPSIKWGVVKLVWGPKPSLLWKWCHHASVFFYMAVKCQHAHKNNSARHDRVWIEVLIYNKKKIDTSKKHIYIYIYTSEN